MATMCGLNMVVKADENCSIAPVRFPKDYYKSIYDPENPFFNDEVPFISALQNKIKHPGMDSSLI